MSLNQISLASYTKDEEWQERSDVPFGTLSSLRWVTHYEIALRDERDAAFLESHRWERFKSMHANVLESRFNRDGVFGELFGFTVCSPAFKASPTEDYLNDVEIALVQSHFDESAAIGYLTERLSGINAADIEGMRNQLSAFLNTEELDYSLGH